LNYKVINVYVLIKVLRSLKALYGELLLHRGWNAKAITKEPVSWQNESYKEKFNRKIYR
jgi:hypothetical protein